MGQKKINFVINKIDPLGQGVSKTTKKVHFIGKTLPGETGSTSVLKASKGVLFSVLEDPNQLTKKSKDRIKPDCPHYDKCSGCHFLHTPYQREISFKEMALRELITKIYPQCRAPIKVIPAQNRTHYRTRIQLHYHKKSAQLGLKKKYSKKIGPIHNCQLPTPKIAKLMQKLYHNNSWLKMAPGLQGHVEIVEADGEISLKWDSPYAHLGFTQVNTQMNQKLVEQVNCWIEKNPSIETIWELFGGQGNLTSQIDRPCTIFDLALPRHQLAPHQTFKQIDLYKADSMDILSQHPSPDALIVNPPREGLKYLAMATKNLKPKAICYVSCHPATMLRDLSSIQNTYPISQLVLVDLFPSTYHFETIAIGEEIRR